MTPVFIARRCRHVKTAPSFNISGITSNDISPLRRVAACRPRHGDRPSASIVNIAILSTVSRLPSRHISAAGATNASRYGDEKRARFVDIGAPLAVARRCSVDMFIVTAGILRR